MDIRITGLRCNYSTYPISVNTATPPFSWQICSEKRDVQQSAYRIVVSKKLENVKAFIGDVWDSGWVVDSESVNILYAGQELESDTEYYWNVAVEVNSNQFQADDVACFVTALLKQSDFCSSFIGTAKVPQPRVWPGGTVGELKGSMFRKTFSLPQKIKRARAFFCGLGWGELYVNGDKIGNSVLDPAPTDYSKSLQYVVHDITDKLTQGENAIGIMVGNGWFSEYRWTYAYGVTPKALLQVNIEYIDGTKDILYTDKSWKSHYSPICENRLWGGEYYDARLEQEGWATADFDDSKWKPVKIKDRSQGILKAQEMPPVRVLDTINPIEINSSTTEEKTIKVFEIPKLIGGWARIKVCGKRGEKVNVKYSDRLASNGFIDQSFQWSSMYSDQTYKTVHKKPCVDTYVLKGNGEECYEPRFTYHPVKYIEIEYDSSAVELIGVQGRHTYSDLDFTGTFDCSNEMYNKIHSAVNQTLKNQMFGIPLDCLNREHWAWMDPASIPGTLYPRQYMPLYWKKWMADIRESQHTNGAIPDLAPIYIQNWHNPDPIWGGSFIRLVWFIYLYHNDRSVLSENYESIKRLFDYHSLHKKDGILTEGTYGDHMLPGERPGEEIFISQETPYEFLWTGWYYESALTLSKVSKILGYDDGAKYEAIANETKNVINEKWFDAEIGTYAGGSQTSQYYALAAGFVPSGMEQKVLDYALNELEHTYNGNLHTGNTGTTAMIDVLGDFGRADVLHEMVKKSSYPGWGYMIEKGSTTIWESWSVDNATGCELSMTMYTTIDEFFFNELCGIKGPGFFGDSLFTENGFKQIVIDPYVPDDMEFANCDIKTEYGRIKAGWQKKGESVFFNLSIPCNTEAVLTFRQSDKREIYESGTLMCSEAGNTAEIEGVKSIHATADKFLLTVGSGNYIFEVR